MAKKWTKALMGLAFTGAAIGGAIAYKKYIVDSDADDEFEDDFEEEDYDLDDHIGETTNREYVTLNMQHSEDTSGETPSDCDGNITDADDPEV